MIPVGGHNRVTLSSLLAWHLGRLIDFTDNEFCGLEPQPQNATKAHVSTTIHHTLRLRLAKTTACVSLAVLCGSCAPYLDAQGSFEHLFSDECVSR
jgi:hypothetical protein